jgi:hypothetical protein
VDAVTKMGSHIVVGGSERTDVTACSGGVFQKIALSFAPMASILWYSSKRLRRLPDKCRSSAARSPTAYGPAGLAVIRRWATGVAFTIASGWDSLSRKDFGLGELIEGVEARYAWKIPMDRTNRYSGSRESRPCRLVDRLSMNVKNGDVGEAAWSR